MGIPRTFVAFALTGLLAASLAGCAKAATAPGKYDQTWSKNYSDTTCLEFRTSMTEQQRWAAAADMLTGARTKGDGITGMPSDQLVTTFLQGVKTACVVDTMSVAETGATLYLTERTLFGGQ